MADIYKYEYAITNVSYDKMHNVAHVIIWNIELENNGNFKLTDERKISRNELLSYLKDNNNITVFNLSRLKIANYYFKTTIYEYISSLESITEYRVKSRNYLKLKSETKEQDDLGDIPSCSK